MTASERSHLGIAKQTAKGTPNTTDAAFKYMLFRTGGVAPNNVVIPLDPEVGGGPMLRNVVKAGVTSGGALDIIPRPETLGWFLLGALGKCVSVADGAAYKHTFTPDDTDPFTAPYFTIRSAPGFMWGEQFQDCRVAGLSIAFAGARFVEGAVTFMGGLPAKVATTTWDADAKVDDGPQFLGPLGDIEIPTATEVKVLSGSVAFGLAIPLDEQWIIGSYTPDDFDIVQRSCAITLNIKVTDVTLYQKMMYDPAAGDAWVANIYKEGDIKLMMTSPELADTAKPYYVDFNFDATADNIAWSVAPIALRAGRQVIMQVTGTVLGSTAPISVELRNKKASYA